ncbi:MAG TPA: DNA-processing protein DprA [bacterium]|nr:DNA-processing protein DprA [bacterium]
MVFEISLEDRAYPDLLRHIHDPPRRLWVQGDSDLLNRSIPVAVVGARECTAYGEKTAYELSRALSEAGATVVSGLAFGIDAAAHRGALDAEGAGGAARGGTIAVLGCGIDLMSPAQNKTLKERIASEGVVVTEFPPGTQAAPWTFPKRNRIVSGLSRGVVVVEAGVKSGSLITADFALQHGREVFAVPGPITSPQSEGTNRLIQNGAKLVLSVRDVLDELGAGVQLPLPERPQAAAETGDAGAVLRLLNSGPRHVDDLIASSGIAVEKLSGLLVDLEIRGRIRALPGGLWEDAGR